MIKQEMFRTDESYLPRATDKQPVDPCSDGDCIPGTIINGTIVANHTVTIKGDGRGTVVITCDDEGDEGGASQIHCK